MFTIRNSDETSSTSDEPDEDEPRRVGRVEEALGAPPRAWRRRRRRAAARTSAGSRSVSSASVGHDPERRRQRVGA